MARCKTPRKGMKRPPRRPQTDDHDAELSELASVIAEHSLDNRAENWFKIPWRDGWNAIELALRTAEARDLGWEDHGWLALVCQRRDTQREVYWVAQDALNPTSSPSWMYRTALRCLQILIANSNGGGEVYNSLLLPPFSTYLPEEVAAFVLEHRCRDAIGVSAQLAGDSNDRLRRAFTIAWKRGLYQAAYALPPAVTNKLTIVKE